MATGMTPCTPPHSVYCRGAHCDTDRFAKCDVIGTCQYKSSAEYAQESKSHLERPPEPVKDFEGAIDGAGIKLVMFQAKSPLQLITTEILEGLAGVLLHGAKKYSADNWRRGMSWQTVYGGILRHLVAFNRGEEIDPESGLPHLHHAACGIMFLSYYAHGSHNTEHRKFDDRPL